MKSLVIMASGSGTNAENIIRYFQKSSAVKVSLVLTNNPQAGVISRAEALGIPVRVFTRQELYQGDQVLEEIRRSQTDLIVLAGFLWLIPDKLLKAYPQRIVNIHPALLPAYGGKGMFGHHVHEAVIRNQEKQSGITIHLIDEEYDRGSNLFQAHCPVLPDDTPDSLAARIHDLEYAHFPVVISEYLQTIQ